MNKAETIYRTFKHSGLRFALYIAKVSKVIFDTSKSLDISGSVPVEQSSMRLGIQFRQLPLRTYMYNVPSVCTSEEIKGTALYSF